MAGLRISGGLTGDRALRKGLESLSKTAPGAVARALYQQGFVVQAEAQRRAPVEFAVLRTAAYTAPPTGPKASPSVEVGFGTLYAAYQHEGTDFEHPRGGEAKFLARALSAKASLQVVAAFARDNLAKGLTTPTIPGAPPRRPPAASSGAKQRAKGRAAKRRSLRRKQP